MTDERGLTRLLFSELQEHYDEYAAAIQARMMASEDIEVTEQRIRLLKELIELEGIDVLLPDFLAQGGESRSAGQRM